MIEIKTDDLFMLKEALESLASKVAQFENPSYYFIHENDVLDVLKSEGLEVIVSDT